MKRNELLQTITETLKVLPIDEALRMAPGTIRTFRASEQLPVIAMLRARVEADVTDDQGKVQAHQMLNTLHAQALVGIGGKTGNRKDLATACDAVTKLPPSQDKLSLLKALLHHVK